MACQNERERERVRERERGKERKRSARVGKYEEIERERRKGE